MTLYAGETVQVTTTATGLDGTTALTSADVSHVKVQIFDSAGDTVVGLTTMTWSAEDLFWFYDWYTGGAGATPTAVEPGTYKAKCTVTGAGTWTSFEYKRIRLARSQG